MLYSRCRVAGSFGLLAVLALLIALLPGRAARAESTPCPYYNFCAYQYPNFQGEVIFAEDCSYRYKFRWTTTSGSWINNQTPGTRARVNYTDGTHWYVPGAYSGQSSGMGWYRVDSIDPC